MTTMRILRLALIIAASSCAVTASSTYGRSSKLTKMPSPEALGQMKACIKETTALKDKNGAIEIIDSESDTSLSLARMVKLPQSTLIFKDFSNETIPYEIDCIANGGVYREFDLDLSCTEYDMDMRRTNHKQLNVVSLPRCYGTTCHADEDPGLLEEYTFRPTSEALSRQNDAGKTWQCAGMLMDGSNVRENFCDVQATSLKEDASMQTAYDAMVQASKNVIGSGESGSISGIAKYQSACENVGGMILQSPIALSCTKKSRRTGLTALRDNAMSVASDYPLCVGSTCNGVPKDAGIIFEQFLKDSGTLKDDDDFEWACRPGIPRDDNGSFFQKVKVEFRKNPGLLYGVCGSAVVSALLLAACYCWVCGSSSKKAQSSFEDDDNDSVV